MAVLYDTNILIEAVKLSQNDKKKFWKLVNSNKKDQFISVVSLAEVLSFAIQSGWGDKRIAELNELLNEITIIDIFNKLVNVYVEIDVYSQGKHNTLSLPTLIKNGKSFKGNAVNMGKNDLWIASTAHLFNFELVTTDDDFDHLKDIFIAINKIDRDGEGKIIL